MNKRLLKKRNTKSITTILNNIEMLGYTVAWKSFGSGYFIFSFDANSVCWFGLKEFPDWKFGIWWNTKICKDRPFSFQIFGENIYMIDKFKPSASILSKTNIFSFMNELGIIEKLLNKPDMNIIGESEEQAFIDWKEYLIDAEEAKQDSIRNRFYSNLIFDTLLKKEKEFGHPFKIKTIDRNTKTLSISPRYSTKVYFDNNVEMSNDDYYLKIIEIYKQLCLSLEDINIPEDSYLETFLFDELSAEIQSPTNFKITETRYDRDGDFEKHLREQWDYYRSYELDDKTEAIIESFYNNNYPDTPSVDGYMNAFERIYEGKYNIKRTRNEVYSYLKKKEKEKSL